MNIKSIGGACTGCSACLHTCPKNAISMQYSDDGFLYPEVDATKCINCGKCNKVCPADENTEKGNNRIRAFSGYINNSDVVLKSSSGGAFSLIADLVMKDGGIVFGAAFDREIKEVVYTSSDDVDFDELRRSKYVASNPHNTFKRVDAELSSGRQVLFCGLPCHVDGLQRYLGKKSNLITCDFICGGSASAGYFKEHLSYLEKKYRSKVLAINFRAKLFGWKEHSIKIEFENGKMYRRHAKCDSFFRGYLEKPFQRDCCYACSYRLGHCSDITIADYWGGVKSNPNNTGVSMIITNSSKGDAFINLVVNSENAIFCEMPLSNTDYAFREEKIRYAECAKKKKIFSEAYRKYGFEKAAEKTYFRNVGVFKLKLLIKQITHMMRPTKG